MKDEIKEIIKFQDILNYYKAKQIEPTYCEELITTGELQHLLDYITNLQEKYEKSDNDRHTLFERNEKAREFIKEKISSTKGVINDYMYHKEHNKILIELLNEDIEMYKNELNILNGGDDNE